MTLSGLYSVADENNIDVYHFPLSPLVSMSTPGAIGIDADAIETTAEEKECLAHELGHCMLDAFYNINTLETRGRMEYKADKWAITHLIPLHELLEAAKNGLTASWDLAEYFGVPVSFVIKAFNYYKRSL